MSLNLAGCDLFRPPTNFLAVKMFRIKSPTRIENAPATPTKSHCSYLDIYISQKIRLCVVDLEGKFQTNLQAKLLNFLVWKFKSIILLYKKIEYSGRVPRRAS